MFAQWALQLVIVVLLFLFLRWTFKRIFKKTLSEEEETTLQNLINDLEKDKENLTTLEAETETTEALAKIETKIATAKKKLEKAQKERDQEKK